jgi:UDP-glucose 4-epimerase
MLKYVKYYKKNIMLKNVEIKTLWDLGIDILVYSDDNKTYPTNIKELRGCNNIIVDKRQPYGYYDVMIDDKIVKVNQGKYNHPSGFGVIYCMEVTF